MSKLRGKGPSSPFSVAPKSFLEGPFATRPILGHPSFEESYLSLANWSSTQGQAGLGERGQRRCPYKEDKLCLLSGLWSQGLFYSALAKRGYSF